MHASRCLSARVQALHARFAAAIDANAAVRGVCVHTQPQRRIRFDAKLIFKPAAKGLDKFGHVVFGVVHGDGPAVLAGGVYGKVNGARCESAGKGAVARAHLKQVGR